MNKERLRHPVKQTKIKISCIWIQVISTPVDPIAAKEHIVGSRKMVGKKYAPYLWKFGFLRFKTDKGEEYKLYEDEIVLVNEPYYDKENDVKEKYIERYCYCGSVIEGRSDKEWCSQVCRYHFRQAKKKGVLDEFLALYKKG
jgi:hypothetical protein